MAIALLSRNTLLIACLFIVSQALGQISYTPFKSINYQAKSAAFYLFFEGESIHFNYEKIGEVQTYNSMETNNKIMLDRIQYVAWKNCANGLILIKSGHAKGSDSGPETVEADLKYYSAIAVRINIDNDFKARYGEGTNMTFVQQVPQRQIQAQKRSKAVTAVCGLSLIMLTIMLISNLTF